MKGKVVSDKMEKTRIVEVETLVRHPLYGRIIKRRRRFMVHNGRNEAKVGDEVRIVPSRPFSKRKRWRIVSILEKGK